MRPAAQPMINDRYVHLLQPGRQGIGLGHRHQFIQCAVKKKRCRILAVDPEQRRRLRIEIRCLNPGFAEKSDHRGIFPRNRRGQIAGAMDRPHFELQNPELSLLQQRKLRSIGGIIASCFS